MKHLRFSILLFSLILSMPLSIALNGDFFAKQSKLSSGKWVKISLEENGVYEITYDELREMGFSNPEKVGVYGKGGEIMDEEFLSAGEKVYYDDIEPIVVLHRDNKLFFYGQGPVKIRYRSGLSNPVNRRFVRQSQNPYSDSGFYFLTDSRDDVATVPTATGTMFANKPSMTECYDYFYHENDLLNFCFSGRLFVGECLTDNKNISIPYSIPGLIEGSSASLECQFYATNGDGSKLNYGIGDSQIASTISAPANLYYAAKAYPAYSEITINDSEGNIDVEYLPNGQSSNAHIDYIIIGAKKQIGFVDNQAQFRAFIPNYSNSQYSTVDIANSSESVIVWDIEDSQSIKSLPTEFSDGVTKAKYFTSNKSEGMMIAFDPDRTQLKISGFEAVENQNLHQIDGDEVPELLIITVPYLHEKAEELADIHRRYDNIDVLVVDSQDIINEFSAGTPDAMAYRAFCKMLYDRNPEKFKNLLLFGEMSYDNRRILSTEKKEMLLSYQTEESLHADMTFCISDFFGMLEDTPSTSGMQYDTVNIGVGELPCRSIADADIVIEKIAHYIVDTSFPYWLNNTFTAGDSPDENEHQEYSEQIALEISSLSQNETAVTKIYLNAYPLRSTCGKLMETFVGGALYGTYLGHSQPNSLSSDESLWRKSYANKLTNTRFPFFNVGGCTVTALDCGERGSTEMMLFNKHGIIGGVMSSRTAYSYYNYKILSYLNDAFNLQSPTPTQTIGNRISERKTVGEQYALAKTNLQMTSSNEFVYHLVADPALVIPFATTCINARIDNEADNAIKAGTEIKFTGTIADRNGNLLPDFNGTIVAKLYAPPATITTHGHYSPAVDVVYDETVVNTIAADVVDGSFSASIVIPPTMPLSEENATIRLAAYDSSSRTAASGIISFHVEEADNETAISDNIPPQIEHLYINTADFVDGDAVNSDFILYAEISDDVAFNPGATDFGAMTYLTLDGKQADFDTEQYCIVSQSGKLCNLTVPFDNMAQGRHTLTLHTADVMGNQTARSITFYVANEELSGKLVVENRPVRESAKFTLTPSDSELEIKSTLYITDALGNHVCSRELSGNTFEWDVKDDAGNRVPQGIYYAHCKLDGGKTVKGASDCIKLIILKD